MPSKPKTVSAETAANVIFTLKRLGTKATRDGMARYAIPSDKAFGVPVSALKKEAKRLGRNHALAIDLWESGWYEARMLATFIDDPASVTPAQMDQWCKDFDNWAIVDTACFHLFDRTPHAWEKVAQWSRSRGEYSKRAAFALLWSLSLHDKQATEAQFLKSLTLIERESTDERNFVKKAVNMALRSIARRSPKLATATQELATRLAASENPAASWIGKDALNEFKKRK